MNRRFPRSTLVKPAPAPSSYDRVSDADLAVLVEQRIAKALNNPPPQLSPPPTSEAVAAILHEAELLRPWAEALTDPRARKLALAAVSERQERFAAGLEKILSADALQHVPALPLVPVP